MIYKILILIFLSILMGCASNREESKKEIQSENKDLNFKIKTMYPALKSYISSLQDSIQNISKTRKQELKKIATYIKEKKSAGKKAELVFICTHNSRRSHLSQVWATVAAEVYELSDIVKTYSGGLAATAFNSRAVAAIERAGFKVEKPEGENPHYLVSFTENGYKIECFSKKYDDPFNPQQDFAAIMTCSQADKNCPLILGAESRIAIPYEDPKEADNTPEETERYNERCKQIAVEMFYLMSEV